MPHNLPLVELSEAFNKPPFNTWPDMANTDWMRVPHWPQIFIDLDGVMADFDAHTVKMWGKTFRTKTKESEDEMWALIDAHLPFYGELELCPGAYNFYRGIAYLAPVILTACPKHDYPRVAVLKKKWSQAKLGPGTMVLATYGGSSKHLFLQHPGDILIDNHQANIDRWEAAGGHGILHRDHDFETTRKRLYELFRPRKL